MVMLCVLYVGFHIYSNEHHDLESAWFVLVLMMAEVTNILKNL